MNSIKRTARVAGLLYLLMGLTAAFSIVYIPSVFIVAGDATATANRIKAAESLYRIGIASDFIAQIIFIFLVLTLYHLLKGVNKRHALLMVTLVIVSVPMSFVNMLNQTAPLIVLSGADFLSVFDQHQLQALAMTFLRLRSHGIAAVSTFWGFGFSPSGSLCLDRVSFPEFWVSC